MPSVSIRNETEVPLMAVLSQLSPLHWTDDPIRPGETRTLYCGKVWFTLSVGPYDASRKPTSLGVACRLGVVVGATVIAGVVLAPAALAVTGTASGVTSTVSGKANKSLAGPGESFKMVGAKKTGVYADGRTYVVHGVHHASGLYQIYFDRVEWVSKRTGAIKRTHRCRRRPTVRTEPFAVLNETVVSTMHTAEATTSPPAAAREAGQPADDDAPVSSAATTSSSASSTGGSATTTPRGGDASAAASSELLAAEDLVVFEEVVEEEEDDAANFSEPGSSSIADVPDDDDVGEQVELEVARAVVPPPETKAAAVRHSRAALPEDDDATTTVSPLWESSS